MSFCPSAILIFSRTKKRLFFERIFPFASVLINLKKNSWKGATSLGTFMQQQSVELEAISFILYEKRLKVLKFKQISQIGLLISINGQFVKQFLLTQKICGSHSKWILILFVVFFSRFFKKRPK